MSDLICPRCGRISLKVEGFRIAMLLRLILRKDYKRLEKFKKLTDEQLVEFYKLWENRGFKGK